MEFHSLTRRELQTLCKKNQIPANITNVAMADALKALEIVEGIEEFLQPSQSETAESSTESPARSELTSPYVPPPTAGRSTRQRNVVKEEPVTVNPMTRSRCTTRKTLVKDADESQAAAIETPALVARTNTKKAQMASACRKMDSQLKECVEEEKKDVLMTPAALGVTSQRRRVKEESAVKRVYSTRRSVRLAEKNVEMLNEEKDDCELPKDSGANEEMNRKEPSDDFDEVSEITGIDAIATMEENSENTYKSEVVSTKKQDISIDKENKLGSTAEEEACIAIAVEEAELDEGNFNKTQDPHGENMVMPLNESNEVQQVDGSYEVCSKIEVTVENPEEMNTEKDTEPEDKAADSVENIILESKVEELSRDEIEKEFDNDKDIDSEDVQDFSVTMVKFTELRLRETNKEVSPGRMVGDVAEADSDFKKDGPDRTEIADPLPLDAPDGEAADGSALAVEGAEDVPFHSASPNKNADFPEQIPTSGKDDKLSQLIGQPTCLTPSKNSASKATITTKRAAGLSDNKENIGSGSKLVLTKDRVMIAKSTAENVYNLHELSVRKLSKMLKEKLEITKKSSKNEHGNEALSRPALQALPENRLVKEAQN